MLARIIIGLLFLIGNFFTNQSSATSIATWNLEWLTSANKTVSDLHIPQRSNNDIVELRRIFSQLSPDILAFQEVNDLEA
ncbi:endonuclease/exonuclease/phosphatase family protein, partial [Vibrio sp.]|nr:endonuclease/exonuclease/phosphatase family protein [Vibrio sp.]